MEEYYGYVYKTVNLINGNIYIGISRRKNKNNKYYGSGKIIRQALDKYGKENFEVEILEECDSNEELFEAEKDYIKIFKDLGFSLYNITLGGEGLTSEDASKYAIERWKSSTKEDRQHQTEKARERYLYLLKNNLLVKKECEYCVSKGRHRKGCPNYNTVFDTFCDECGARYGSHKKGCSNYGGHHFKDRDSWIKNLKEAANSRTKDHYKKISEGLKRRWKEEEFILSMTCNECGGKSSNHKKGCSKFKGQKEFICEFCGRRITGRGNLKKHLKVHHEEEI